MSEIRLSKSQVETFKSCPRCFWLARNHKLKRPDGISSKVWKGIEREVINHFQRHREAGTLPPELTGQVPEGAVLYIGDRISMKDLRYWGKGLQFMVGPYRVTTGLDDLLQRGEGDKRTFNNLDYKTKSKATDEANTYKLYHTQHDFYDLALNANGYPTDGMGYYPYSYPANIKQGRAPDALGHGILEFEWRTQVIGLKADHAAAKDLITRAGQCLEGPLPDPGEDCDFCPYDVKRALAIEKIIETQRSAAAAVGSGT